jgi:hypothetical protein
MTIVLNGTTGITNTGALSVTGITTLGALGSSVITSGTSVASTSGTSIDFTGIPTWVKRITVMFNGVSTSGTSNILLQLGTSSGVETTSYVSGNANASTVVTNNTSTQGHLVDSSVSGANVDYGHAVITLISGNTWVGSSQVNNGGVGKIGNSSKALAGTLDRVRITTVNGTDTFDAGTINILYE